MALDLLQSFEEIRTKLGIFEGSRKSCSILLNCADHSVVVVPAVVVDAVDLPAEAVELRDDELTLEGPGQEADAGVDGAEIQSTLK